MEWWIFGLGLAVIVVVVLYYIKGDLWKKQDKISHLTAALKSRDGDVEMAERGHTEKVTRLQADHKADLARVQKDNEDKYTTICALHRFIDLFINKKAVDEVLNNLALELSRSFDVNIELLQLRHETDPEEVAKKLERLQCDISNKKRAFWDAVKLAQEVMMDYPEVKSFRDLLLPKLCTEAEKTA